MRLESTVSASVSVRCCASCRLCGACVLFLRLVRVLSMTASGQLISDATRAGEADAKLLNFTSGMVIV